jgi:hypothetical protein
VEAGKITEEGTYAELSRREGGRFRSLMAAQLALERSKPDVQRKSASVEGVTESEASVEDPKVN